MKILVTGGAGYIGSIVVRLLLEKGHKVRIMDTFNFGFDPIKEIIPNPDVEIYPGDIKKIEDIKKALNGVDGVIHLAAIVGDPACAVQADNAIETNYLATLRLAMAAREAGVNKFVFSSTCSVYGAGDGILTEESPLNPQSLYGETKILAEKGIMDLSSEKFRPIIYRLGTLYGLSPRMRFDLVINYLTGKIMTENKAMIFGGEQWRPFLHVYDAARAFVYAIENYGSMAGEIYNVGSTKENYQMKDIGHIFEEIFPDADIEYLDEVKDPRSYRVSFEKIESKGFSLTRGIKESILEIKKFIEDNGINPKDPIYYNYHP